MQSTLQLRDRNVLVTGASSGLGLEMARQLARDHGAHPILVARRRDRLEALAGELTTHGVRPSVIAADMTKPEDVERTFREATAKPLHAAILNAGVTYFGYALEQSPESISSLIATNVQSVVSLTQSLVPYLIDRKEGGGLMIVSSMTSLQPMPFQAMYAASKAFISSYALALAEEIRDQPVSITVFVPGGISTEMAESSGLSRKYGKDHPMMMSAEECSEYALRAFIDRKLSSVPGALNNLAAFGSVLAPRKLVTRLVGNDYRGALPKRS